ncbi:MAG: hydroxypyruvate isomerase [Gammaproteobacteria bacterium]
MPRFAANLTMLFTEVEFLDRFALAAAAGFKGVEYLFPYDYPSRVLVERLNEFGLQQVLHNLPAGEWERGERGIACLPDRREEFRQGVEQAIEYARALGCPRLNCLAGIRPDGLDEEEARATFIENLRYAAGRLAEHDLQLLIEPINTQDIPGFFLCHTAQAMEIIRAVGVENLALQYDIYHMQIMEGNLAQTIERLLPHIGHMQLADNPGRHEPGSGEIHYPFLFRHLDAIGYSGWIGCEYNPLNDTQSGLGWVQPYLAGDV